MGRSSAALFNESLELLPGYRRLASAEGGYFLLQGFQTFRGPADFLQAVSAFGNKPGDGFLMPGDDDFLTANHPVEQFTKPGLCFECWNGRHIKSLNQSVND
jgi:hypothetical protein